MSQVEHGSQVGPESPRWSESTLLQRTTLFDRIVFKNGAYLLYPTQNRPLVVAASVVCRFERGELDNEIPIPLENGNVPSRVRLPVASERFSLSMITQTRSPRTNSVRIIETVQACGIFGREPIVGTEGRAYIVRQQKPQ